MLKEKRHISSTHWANKPERVLALGFFLVIVVGTLLFLLPISTVERQTMGLLNAMFTATSAVCVTGLVTTDVGNTFSMFGQVILLILIQVGGLGFMAFAALFMVTLGKRISLRNRLLLSESMSQTSLQGMVRMVLELTLMAFLIEAIGAIILSTRFIPHFGLARGIWYGVFHSVSAFCNAGFDLLGNYTSFAAFKTDHVVMLTFVGLIFLGGLGFTVLFECKKLKCKLKKASLHTKLVLITTACLIISGTILVFALEYTNPKTLQDSNFSFIDKVINSLFQAVTFRTAGFSILDQASLTDTTKLIGIVQMFIGASPVSTGGGIKTTTFAMLVLLVYFLSKGSEEIQVLKRRVAINTIRRAVSIAFIAISLIFVTTCIISVVERSNNYNMVDIVFETTSAFSTTGLSTLSTQNLNPITQWLLMPLMYFGRVGPLTIALALANRFERRSENRIHFPEEKIMIG